MTVCPISIKEYHTASDVFQNSSKIVQTFQGECNLNIMSRVNY